MGRISARNSEISIRHDSLNKGPRYSLHIDGDGNVEYHGISDVKTLGKHITKLLQGDLENVIFEFQNVYFFSFKDSYGSVSNHLGLVAEQKQLQQTTISFRLANRYKNVKFVDEGYKVPFQLKKLVKTIERITKVDQLSGIDLYTPK